MAVNPLIRYNEIQKALSALRRESGVKFKASFQKTASLIYHSTKKEDLKYLLQNIDKAYENIIPVLPSELLEWSYYFDFDIDNRTKTGKWSPSLAPQNLFVKSQIFIDDIPIDASILSYDDHFKDFSDYCNANRMYFPDKYGAMWKFTEPKFDRVENKWLTFLEIDNLYGYEPGMGATVNEEEVKSHIKEPVKLPEADKAKEPEKAAKPDKEDFEIRKIQAETEKIKASEKKLTEFNKATESLDSQLKRKLITKKQYSKYLRKLYDM